MAHGAQGAKDAIAAMRRSHDEFGPFVQGLAPDQLERRSGASEWTVADVLSHMGSASVIGLNTLTTGKADMAGAQPIWDRWNAMSPSEKRANFLTAEGNLVAALEALDEKTLADTTLDVGFLPGPIDIEFFVSMRLSEVGQHRWDVEVAFDETATVADYLVPFILDVLLSFASYFSKPAGMTGRVAVATTNPTKSYVLELAEDGLKLTEGTAADAGTRLSLPAEAWVRLIGGRLAPVHTPASVTVDGDLSLDDLRSIFPGY